MTSKSRFVYTPKELASQNERISQMNSISCPSDEEVCGILERLSDNSPLPDIALTDREIAGLVIWADEKNRLDDPCVRLVSQRNNPVLQKYLYKIWQDRFDSGPVSDISTSSLRALPLPKDWQRCWEKLMTSESVAFAAAGTAAFYCSEHSATLEGFRRHFCISAKSGLWRKMSALFYCICDAERFDCSDSELCGHIRDMEQEECICLLRNMLRCFPLFSGRGEIYTEHEVYVSRYRSSVTMLTERMSDSPYALLLRNFLAASEIPDSSHRDYWEYSFLNSRPVSERIGYYIFRHDDVRGRFIVYGGDVIVVDAYAENRIYRLPLEKHDSAELPDDLEEICTPRDVYSGERWRQLISSLNFIVSEAYGSWEGRRKMENDKIIKLEVRYTDGTRVNRVTYENPEGLYTLRLPNFPNDSEMCFTTDCYEDHVIRFSTFKNIITDNIKALTRSEREAASFLLDGDNSCLICERSDQTKPPYVIISDITEKYLLDYPELSMEIINGKDAGIWGGCGKRLLMFSFEPDNLPDADVECQVDVKRLDSGEFDFVKYPFSEVKHLEKAPKIFLCTLDTQEIQNSLNCENTNSLLESELLIRLSYSFNNVMTEEYHFPFSLFINNTDYSELGNKCRSLDLHSRVSIDFGTSSTCVAVSEGGIRMIEMSPDVSESERGNIYENPTNLMLYRYDLISEEWSKSPNNNHAPLLRRNGENDDFSDYLDEYSAVAFDYGHKVKRDTSGNQRTMDSIIKNLKMLPKSEHDGYEQICIPYNIPENAERVVRLTSESREGGDRFNPIKFYGYLLGKAINHPNGERNKYYTKYVLSFPVKFDESAKEKIRESIKSGILLSLPKDIQKMVDDRRNPLFRLDMSYSEPVACVGAACGYELKLGADNSPVLFAVFDLGGGTLDFSFGMYRKADIDTEGYDDAIELFGTDGDDNIGGETLIRKIAYWIFSEKESNYEVLRKEHILFEKPADESIPDGYNDLIQSHSQIAKANMQKLCEKFARPFFEGKEIETADGKLINTDENTGEYIEIVLPLISANGKELSDGIKLKVNLGVINDGLRKEFKNICNIFKKTCDNVFGSSYAQEKMKKYGASYDKPVRIIMTGNASQHKFVRQNLNDIFKEENVCLIGEGRGEEIGEHYRVTPKTAVAVGQLRLANTLVIEPKKTGDVFRYYVAVEKNTGAEMIINKHSDVQWKRVGVFTDGFVKVFYNGIDNIENLYSWKTTNLEYFDPAERRVCWIRPKDMGILEYIAAPLGKDPNSDDSIIEEILEKELQ